MAGLNNKNMADFLETFQYELVITVKTRGNCIKHSRASDVVKYHTGSSSQLDISSLFYIIPPSDVNIKTRKN